IEVKKTLEENYKTLGRLLMPDKRSYLQQGANLIYRPALTLALPHSRFCIYLNLSS
ncbi:hypothetical protein M5D96_012312, partial [Drosophila gunungcola]